MILSVRDSTMKIIEGNSERDLIKKSRLVFWQYIDQYDRKLEALKKGEEKRVLLFKTWLGILKSQIK